MRARYGVLMRACALAALLIAASVQAQQVELRGVAAFPKGMSLTDDFMRFIDMVNAAGKGVVQIRFIGGPEVMPVQEQGVALGKGVYDVLFGPPTYYTGVFPEADAFAGDTLPPEKIRAAGGDKLYDQALARRVNSKLLAFAGGDVGLYLFLKDAPKLRPDGMPDLSGIKLRSAALYQDMLVRLGATPVVINGADVYTALERGLVTGIGWNLFGLTESGWNRFLNYRVEPAMYKSSIAVLINLDKWKSLSEPARQTLAKVGIEYEAALGNAYRAKEREEIDKLGRAGMKAVRLEGNAAEEYRRLAFETMWQRVEKNKNVQLDLPAVRRAFYGR